MMDKRIPQFVRRILKRTQSRDPFEIAEQMGITVLIRNDFVRQKGAFKVLFRNRFIFINGNLSEQMRRLVCAHELGHALLHRQLGASATGLVEFEVFDIKDQTEYDANAFAAALLLDDEELLEILRDGYDVVQAARLLETNVNLVLLKINEINRQGYELRLPCSLNRHFLGTISDDAGHL